MSPAERPAGEHRTDVAEPRPPRLVQAPAVLVLLAAAAGMAVIASTHWKRGVVVLAAAMLLGGALRLALPARRAGLLAVRTRAVDVATFAGLGAAILLVALVVPPSRP